MGFAKLSHSLNNKIEATKARAEIAEEVLKVAEERELKLWEELSASCNTIQELEARVAKKKKIIAKRWAYDNLIINPSLFI